MKTSIFTFLITLIASIGHSQTDTIYLDGEQFKNADISILSTSVELSKNDSVKKASGIQVVKFKFLDYADKKIKYYEADIGKHGYVSQTKKSTPITGSLKHLSILTVPFKVRSRNDNGYITAQADVKNIGVYFPLILWNNKRYFLNNNTSQHKFSLGLIGAPMVQKLDNKNTENFFGSEDNSYDAFMISAAVAGTYTYNSITFTFIPLGFDFGTDQAGKEWVNHGKRWVGFGLGIDTKLFGF